jgi:hypothetical protein
VVDQPSANIFSKNQSISLPPLGKQTRIREGSSKKKERSNILSHIYSPGLEFIVTCIGNMIFATG